MPEVLDQQPETEEDGEEQGFQFANESGDYRDLPEDLVSWFKSQAEKWAREESFARWNEVRDTAKQHFYRRTQQHIFWSNKDGYLIAGGSGSTGVPSGASSGSEEVDAPRFMRDFNIFESCGRALFAALTENFPGVRFEPNRVSDPMDIAAAKAKNLYRKQFERDADIRRVQREICRLALTDGKIGVEVYSDDSGANYGTDESELVEKCRVRGVLSWKTPILTQDQTAWPYAICSEDLPTLYLKFKHDWIKDKIKPAAGPTLGEHPWSRTSRLTVQQGTYTKLSASDAANNLTTRHEVWFAPCSYIEAPEEYQQFLQQEFPDGFKATFCGEVYAEAEKAGLLKRLSWYHPVDGDGQATPSLLLVLVSPQDIFNDFMNLMTELVEECIPRMHFDAQLIDPDARREQRSEPGAGGPVYNPMPGQPLENFFFREDGGEVSPQLIAIIQWIAGQLCQMLSGASAALLGAANPEMGDTATAYEMSADKSLGVLGGPWGNLQTLFCSVESQAADLAKEARGDAQVDLEGEMGMMQTLDFGDFKGNTKAFPESDSSFPTTYKQRVEKFFALLQAAATSPAALQLVNKLLAVPENEDRIKELTGLDDWVWPEADAEEKQLTEIKQLLGTIPLPNKMAAEQYAQALTVAKVSGGQPPPPPDPMSLLLSSIQPAKYDNNAVELQSCIDFINSPEGQEKKKQFDQLPPEQSGWVNLLLHADAHKAAIPQPQPEPPKESMSTNFKDLPPTAQSEYLKHKGITVSTDELMDNKLLESKAVIDKVVGGKEQLPAEQIPKGLPEA